MTEQEAVETLVTLKGTGAISGEEIEAIDIIDDAMFELQQYREIGTVEECRAAVEKQIAAKPLGGMDIEGNEYAICRECSSILSDGEWLAQYCPDCGKKVDWGEKEQG